jgi:molybdate transport system regulatory protein
MPRRTPPSAARAPTKASRSRSKAAVAVDGALWLRRGGQALGGADRVALLEAIRDTGSMTRAARAVGISYKTAWDHVQDMNNVAERALVQRSAGGAGGGGTTLTAEGLALIAAFRQVEREHGLMLERLSTTLADPAQMLKTLARLGLRTSARNQLVGSVTRVQAGAVNAMVELALPGADDRITASLTLASLRRLGIVPGTQAVALIKAPSVFLAAPGKAQRLSVGNCLQGQVSALLAGAAHAEVQARLAGGQTMVAMLGLEALRTMGIVVGAPVQLLFQESSVILGVE